ncbi:unnamed protein product [Peronospora belbahrii]|uniref:HTH myb-type domain-containing protein n=1 Tax=Peronospora belbahrii TaxID=622444 RepID=A0AAU9L5T9_9STRA|nr:unnamed protein product [Peronospora belbahrii]
MTISRGVYNQLFEQAPDATDGSKEKIIRLRPTEAKAGAIVMSAKSKIQMWTKEEHDRFLAALEKFPAGPWKKVADYIGTKTPRQTMTHAQKYRQKIHRRQRGLRNQKKNVKNENTLDKTTTNSTGCPALPMDTKEGLKVESNTIVSPYGVADLQLKPGAKAAVAAVAGATNDQLLTILAQQATTIHDKPESMELDQGTMEVDLLVSPKATAVDDNDGSANNNLPSLAEILHLGGGEGQTAATLETQETTQSVAKDSSDPTAETKLKVETVTTETKTETQIRPKDCKCKCSCSLHGKENVKVNATTTQTESEES